MEHTILRKDIQAELEKIKEADILLGIPSYNNARTIGHVVRAAQAGLAKYFPDKKAVLVNSDGGSTDGTTEIVQNTTIDDFASVMLHHRRDMFRISTPYHGLPGKGSAFRTIFEIAEALDVKACAVVDSDLRSITPEWIELLIKPVMEGGFDYVAPLYLRHKYDGTITNSIVYPLTRALYGKRVRQPIGGDFGFSGKLAKFYLTKDVWETDVAKYGIDIWMTTTAIANDFRVCQSFLGAKIHDPKDPGADLSAEDARRSLHQPGEVDADRVILLAGMADDEVGAFAGHAEDLGDVPFRGKAHRRVMRRHGLHRPGPGGAALQRVQPSIVAGRAGLGPAFEHQGREHLENGVQRLIGQRLRQLGAKP